MQQDQAPKTQETPERDHTKGFDDRVHVRDAKTGKLVRIQDYAKIMSGRKVMFERPIGSGNMYAENGETLGRWDVTDPSNWKQLSKEHVKTKPAPANTQEQLKQENESLREELELLRAELSGEE